MDTCARPVFPEAALASVAERLPKAVPIALPTLNFGRSDVQGSFVPIAQRDNTIVEDDDSSITTQDMLQRHTGDYGSICFVVRRPG